MNDDYLTNLECNQASNVIIHDHPRASIAQILLYDILGVITFHLIAL